MDQIDVNGCDIFILGIDIKFGIQGIPCVDNDQVTGFGTRNGFDGGMVTIETVRVIFTMLPFFLHFNDGLCIDIGGVSKSIAH